MASINTLYQILHPAHDGYSAGDDIVLITRADDGTVYAHGWICGNPGLQWGGGDYTVADMDAAAETYGIGDTDLALAVSQLYDVDCAPYVTAGRLGLSVLAGYSRQYMDVRIMRDVTKAVQATTGDVQIRDAANYYRPYTAIIDGGLMDVCYPDGSIRTRTVNRIDDYHLQVGCTCYHIDQWAEIMGRQGAYCRPHMTPVQDAPAPGNGPDAPAPAPEDTTIADNLARINAAQAGVAAWMPRSCWDRGVKAYILDLLEALQDDTVDLDARPIDMQTLLNGASDWTDYSYGGCSLIYDTDIAARLCTQSERRKTDGGRKRPNAQENWLDVQARALHQAADRLIDWMRQPVQTDAKWSGKRQAWYVA